MLAVSLTIEGPTVLRSPLTSSPPSPPTKYSLDQPLPSHVCVSEGIPADTRAALEHFRSADFEVRQTARLERNFLRQLEDMDKAKLSQVFQLICNINHNTQREPQTVPGDHLTSSVMRNPACERTRTRLTTVFAGAIEFLNPQATILEIQRIRNNINGCVAWFAGVAQIRGLRLNTSPPVAYRIRDNGDGSMSLQYTTPLPSIYNANCARPNGEVIIPAAVACGLRQTGVLQTSPSGEIFLKDNEARDETLQDPAFVPQNGLNHMVAPIGQ